MKFNSQHIKIALMSYYRYKRQYLCADEVGLMVGNIDVLVDTGKDVIEVEVKTSKSDMWQGEKAKADKHRIYLSPDSNPESPYSKIRLVPNYFFMCVPTELVEEARKWTESVNPKYGVMEFKSQVARPGWYNVKPEDFIRVAKKAKSLTSAYKEILVKDKIARRLCSANIQLWRRILSDMEKENGNKSQIVVSVQDDETHRNS